LTPNDKEKYIIESLPMVFFAIISLQTYQAKEGITFLNAVLAFSMETMELPVDMFNEYNLGLRGRSTQGVLTFKN
jgi:hypothetical protein